MPRGVAVCASWQQARVLVVDDHNAYRLLMSALLHKLGVACEAVGDGQSALEALAARRFDLVISDCRMPVMDGYALARELRRRKVDIPVIALTTGMGPEQITRCLEAGMDGWLLKPVGLEQLRDLLSYWLPGTWARPLQPWSPATSVLHRARVPTRADLITIFGSWEALAPLLQTLLSEAQEDLRLLERAQISQDILLATQRLHRLVGSLVFLGAGDLERQGMALIENIHVAGMAENRKAMQRFRRRIESYLIHLANL
ncbi:hypothetical protein TU73_15920 [Pseudomonas libanensis]|uniref:Response regulatory domain-containing protein n=1 Tax=Pseudomonas libanensis TaxID=75588 RepID=A0A0R2YDW7_9PSED|nr:response regulator [Pseudomonas libanensis]KRP44641.1 hypothetical protein TU73_15920 [Pseudomonas libanensis]